MHSLPALALDRCPDAVFVIRTDGRFEYVNRTACQALNYRRDELLGLAFWDIDPHIGIEEWDANLQILKENRRWTVTTEHRRRGGSVFPVEIIATLEQYSPQPGTAVEFVIAYARNLTNTLAQLEVTVRSVLRERALSRLTGNERSVFDLLECKASEKEITHQLNISRSTFYRVKRRISVKLGVDSEPRGFWW